MVLGTAIVLTWLVSRSITKPLRSLTRQAKEMAERRLPDAVHRHPRNTPRRRRRRSPPSTPSSSTPATKSPTSSTALNTVQDTALDLAVEQAVLRRNIADSFVNLGRRNQNLLGRQLDFITELETNETDPDTLSNLFRLDHLATRMRRNAESLLVLAGIEPPRKWAAPVRLTDVIRAALGEVEDYQRVTVRGVEPATIIGSAAADLAHLLAELIENALVFSPPDQTVDIRGRQNPHGYTLAVIDSGLGMPQTDITAANRRLAGAESFTIAPSKYLGHYVAGNLAARHNIHVTLDNSPGNGITATIDLPPTLLTTDSALPSPDEPHAARDVWPPAPALGRAARRRRRPRRAVPARPARPRPRRPAGRTPAAGSRVRCPTTAGPPRRAPARSAEPPVRRPARPGRPPRPRRAPAAAGRRARPPASRRWRPTTPSPAGPRAGWSSAPHASSTPARCRPSAAAPTTTCWRRSAASPAAAAHPSSPPTARPPPGRPRPPGTARPAARLVRSPLAAAPPPPAPAVPDAARPCRPWRRPPSPAATPPTVRQRPRAAAWPPA